MQAERTQACGTADATLREYGVFYTASIHLTKVLYKTIFTGKR